MVKRVCGGVVGEGRANIVRGESEGMEW